MIYNVVMMVSIAIASHNAVKPKPAAPLTPPADVWLDCQWSEKVETTVILGGASNVSKREDQRQRIYVFSKANNTFSSYYPQSQALVTEKALIGDRGVIIEEKDESNSLFHSSKSLYQWSVYRSDLSVHVLGNHLEETQMEDSRLSTLSTVTFGSGKCSIIEPQPLAMPKPNQF